MIECINFKSYKEGCLQGFADFYISKWKAEIYGCKLYSKDGRRWVTLPSKEYINDEGEKKYSYIFRFRESKDFKVFMEHAKLAIDKWCYENFPEDEDIEKEPYDTIQERLF